jgi:hypothetical protein
MAHDIAAKTCKVNLPGSIFQMGHTANFLPSFSRIAVLKDLGTLGKSMS